MREFIAAILLIFSNVGCWASTPTPEQIIAAFFGPTGISDKAAYYTGEMKEFLGKPTLGEGLRPGIEITSRRLTLSSPQAPVYAVDLQLGNNVDNWYAFFAPEGGYLKLKAVRTLGLTGIPYMTMESLKKIGARTAEQEWTYQNLKLLFRPDRELIAHFRDQISELDSIKSLIDANQTDAARSKMRSLYLSGFERSQFGLQIWIGGMLNNVVGVLHVPPDQPSPKMDESEYIYIEHIAGPWFIYKSA